MDSATRRLVGEIRDYLQDVQGRTQMPISMEQVESLNEAADQLEHRGEGVELSPGQKAALSASDAFIADVPLDTSDGLSPGERAAENASFGDS